MLATIRGGFKVESLFSHIIRKASPLFFFMSSLSSLQPLFSNRQPYEVDDCLDHNREDYQNCHYSYMCAVILASSYNFRFRSF